MKSCLFDKGNKELGYYNKEWQYGVADASAFFIIFIVRVRRVYYNYISYCTTFIQ